MRAVVNMCVIVGSWPAPYRRTSKQRFLNIAGKCEELAAEIESVEQYLKTMGKSGSKIKAA
jgi:hypothetical protein